MRLLYLSFQLAWAYCCMWASWPAKIWNDWGIESGHDAIMKMARDLLEEFYTKGAIDGAVTETGEPFTPQDLRAIISSESWRSTRLRRRALAGFDAIHASVRAKYGLES